MSDVEGFTKYHALITGHLYLRGCFEMHTQLGRKCSNLDTHYLLVVFSPRLFFSSSAAIAGAAEFIRRSSKRAKMKEWHCMNLMKYAHGLPRHTFQPDQLWSKTLHSFTHSFLFSIQITSYCRPCMASWNCQFEDLLLSKMSRKNCFSLIYLIFRIDLLQKFINIFCSQWNA